MAVRRKLMRGGDSIVLCKKNTSNQETFHIRSMDKSGASAVCYIASCAGKTGRLKEFYPESFLEDRKLTLDRRGDRQLVCPPRAPQLMVEFQNRMEEYIRAYEMLEQEKAKAPDRAVFNTFVPPFEIYRGCDADGACCGSVYIWSVDNNGAFKTFEELLREIHRHPAKNPEKSVLTILHTVLMLAECIKCFHDAGMLHMDIKPKNFGCPVRNNRYLSEQISLFDIDSICAADGPFTKISVTPEFCDPEVFRGNIGTFSDIYSIGATLFRAVVLCDDIPDSLYTPRAYSELEQILSRSRLLRPSPVTASRRFCYQLAQILRKCLSPRLYERYSGCEELMKDLRNLLTFLLPGKSGQELAEINRELDAYHEPNAVYAMQELLFHYPLYESAGDTIRVLVLGFGIYGQLFTDMCLQIGQMPNCRLEVRVACNDVQFYKEEYLSQRPALKDFFQIDGAACSGDSYGSISFVPVGGETGFNTSAIYNQKLIRDLTADFMPNYIVTALQEDQISRGVARACSKVLRRDSPTIAWICAQSDDWDDDIGCVPVNVRRSFRNTPQQKAIERMAFNTHLSWSITSSINVDFANVRRDFRDRYNHNSSVSCVLAIKYKLHSLGLELSGLDQGDLDRVAQCFVEKLTQDPQLYAELIQVEHRRWVVEKITDGWTRLEDLTVNNGRKVIDQKNKRHPCILRSRADFKLEDTFRIPQTKQWDREKWDTPGSHDDALDELDLLSVQIHRMFAARAEKIRARSILHGSEATRLAALLASDRDASRALHEYLRCLEQIWKGSEAKTRLYDGLYGVLYDTVSRLPQEIRSEAEHHLGAIHQDAAYVISAFRFEDYKAKDKMLVEAIPFILTFRDKCRMFVPLAVGDNEQRFSNVAAATLINPASITYACEAERPRDLAAIRDTMESVVGYRKSKNLRADFRMLLIYGGELTEAVMKQFAHQLEALSDGLTCRICPAAAEGLRKTVEEHSRGMDLYERNRSFLSGQLSGAGFYEGLPSFSFRSTDKQFSADHGAEWIGYLGKNAYLTVSDLFSLQNSTGTVIQTPEFSALCHPLWALYTKDRRAWKQMCACLAAYAEQSDRIASFSRRIGYEIQTMEFVVPIEARAGYLRALEWLRDREKVIGPDSCIEYRSTESCTLRIVTGRENAEAVRMLVRNPYRFALSRELRFVPARETAEICFDSLVVENLQPGFHCDRERLWELLTALEDSRMLSNLTESEGALSFTYATRQVKRLLTDPEQILRIYVYHRAMETGFDDVVSGYHLTWGNTDAASAFDCVMTSGFRSLMVECRSGEQLREDDYFRLDSLLHEFGINTVPVLIADGLDSDETADRFNRTRQAGGGFMKIVTVSDPEKITDIGHTLKDILDSYDSDKLMKE